MSKSSLINSNFFNYSNNSFLMLTSKSNCSNNFNEVLKKIDLNISNQVSVKQIHSNKIIVYNKQENQKEADGIITNINSNLFLSIMTADCMPIFIYDNFSGYYGLIHAGWRGVVAKIHKNAIFEFEKLGSSLKNISIFIGPSIKKCCFEVKTDIINNFHSKYVIKRENKFYINLLKNVLDDLVDLGVLSQNISFDEKCTYEDSNCCSYRRDGLNAGRMISLIYYKKGQSN